MALLIDALAGTNVFSVSWAGVARQMAQSASGVAGNNSLRPIRMVMSPRCDRLAILTEIRRSSRRLTLEASIRGIVVVVHCLWRAGSVSDRRESPEGSSGGFLRSLTLPARRGRKRLLT